MYSVMIVLQFDNTDKKNYRINSKIVIFVVKPKPGRGHAPRPKLSNLRFSITIFTSF